MTKSHGASHVTAILAVDFPFTGFAITRTFFGGAFLPEGNMNRGYDSTYLNVIRPAKSSDKAEDIPLLGIFFFKSSSFPIYFEIIQFFQNCTGHSK